ncbi:flagellar protein FlbD [Ornithinibacillus gellani]|uniref:flagellar FlbD family protein n=1 Tax=Ornithinibacillus gellani TaxID=2293253 RepID=UPI000F4698D3|nr:flagellar FlbD family protein [Ornithinibacillus gellani]TQS75552.1 flagellar protein FlbD [Ornithinibacillus gellani]
MIELTRLNGDVFLLNALMIKELQSLPDTTITLIDGKKIVVREQVDAVSEMITSYYQQIGLQQLISKAGESNE